MKEFGAGTLHTSSGEIVTDKDQAVAIAFSEAEHACRKYYRRKAKAKSGKVPKNKH